MRSVSNGTYDDQADAAARAFNGLLHAAAGNFDYLANARERARFTRRAFRLQKEHQSAC